MGSVNLKNQEFYNKLKRFVAKDFTFVSVVYCTRCCFARLQRWKFKIKKFL